LVIPVPPRSFDIWAVDQVAELVKEAREINPALRAVPLLHAADAQGRDNEDAGDALQEIAGLEVLPVTIGRRKAFPSAAARCRAVTEVLPRDAKAVAELQAPITGLYI
jgi:chromosome partitioning protein